jgi:hypothetical protein
LSEFQLEIRSNFLVWKAGLANRIIDGGDPPGVLREFVGIDSPAKVLKFAQRFGVLGCCQHGLPYTHPYKLARVPWSSQIKLPHLDRLPRGVPRPLAGICRPLGWPPDKPAFAGYFGECWEPLDVWFHFSRQARALLQLAADIALDKPGRREDWECVYENAGSPRFDPPKGPAGLTIQSNSMIDAVNFWLRLGGVGLMLDRNGVPKLDGDGLFGEIAYQLGAAITHRRFFLVCAHCATVFEAKILRKDPIRLCALCRRKSRWSRAQQRARKRKNRD